MNLQEPFGIRVRRNNNGKLLWESGDDEQFLSQEMISVNRPTAYLISCSDHYEHRLRIVDEQLKKLGYRTAYITSDFDHTTKSVFLCDVPGCVQLHVTPYFKNLSLRRIISHWEFARKVFRFLVNLEEKPAVVVSLLPPNFLAHYLAAYKRQNRSVKLVFDIFDLWPETFPVAGAKKLLAPAFSLWAGLRDRNLSEADLITTECELFREKLGLPEENSAVVYLCGEDLKEKLRAPQLAQDRWDLCYLGAVNNVIDIPGICRLIAQLRQQKPVSLHIMGAGEQLGTFMEQAEKAGAEVSYYGAVYEDDRKQDVIHKCHFGLNIVRSTACIGLTMKSVEYFRHGLPIINNVPADTRKLVEKENVGIQLGQQAASTMEHMSVADCMKMRENVRKLFADRFSKDVAQVQYQTLLNSWL